jgi:tonB-dependent outer membrane receptor
MAVVLSAADVFAQQTFVIKGRVMEAETKEPLIGASVRCGSTGTATDVDGNYELSMKEGSYDIECSYIGFENDRRRIILSCDTILDFSLQSSTSELSEVVVLSRSVMDRLKNTQPGMERIDLDEMSKTPVLFGERDILKSLQLLPGVSAEGDGTGGFQVRGGTASQNLVLLDDAPVINSGHLFGFFSTFNDPALSSATLYKGQIPARYGGATSSVFDVNTKAGNSERYKGSFTVGLLSAKFDIEGPIIKDKLSFFVSSRRSYMDMFLKFTDQFKDNSLYFYDINAKVNYNIGYNDKLAVSLFVGRDNLGMSDMMNMQWGNITTTAKWYHTFNDQLASVATLYHGNFINDMGMQITSEDDNMNGHLRQTGIKYTFSWNPHENHYVDFGLQSALIDLKSAEWTMGTTHQKEQRRGWENGVWINDDWAINERVHVMGGLRLGIMSALGGSPYYKVDEGGNITDSFTPRNGKPYKTYLSVEPRLSINYRITDLQSIKMAYSRSSQNIHAIRSTGSSMPFDRYAMTSNIIKPQTADQVSAGYVALFGNTRWEISGEVFYKNIRNIYDYKDGKSFNSEIEIERLLLGGKGRAYGFEFTLRKNAGKLTGWVGYTLSWAQNKIDGINNGEWYTAGNDRRHDISVVGIYQFNKKWNMSAAWVFNTGQALTAPSAKYEVDGIHMFHYAERNGYRAPAYHRLDLSATYTHEGPKLTYEWSFGIYNAYSRYNPFLIVFETDENAPTGFKTMKHSLFGLVPSVSYTLKF